MGEILFPWFFFSSLELQNLLDQKKSINNVI